jgi:hypothetical protein
MQELEMPTNILLHIDNIKVFLIKIVTKNKLFQIKNKKFVTQSRTDLQIYEGHDDQLNRPGPMA